MSRLVDQANHPDLLDALTKAVARNRLGFPREVVDELQVIARDEPIWSWAMGVKGALGPYDMDVANLRPFMGHVHDLGFTDGIETLDGKENCIPAIGCLCLDLGERSLNFVLATEDVGETPLRPTMEQIAKHIGWSTVDAQAALEHLQLGHLLS